MTLISKTQSTDNVVLEVILSTLNAASQWRGTMTELDSVLVSSIGRNRTKLSALPGSPSALRVVLNRIAPRLRARGVSVKFGRTTDSTRTRFVKLVKPARV
jgi:hypothetical protein